MLSRSTISRFAGVTLVASALLTPSAVAAATPRGDTERGRYMEFHWYRETRAGFAAVTVLLSRQQPSIVVANLISNDPERPSYWSRLELQPSQLASVDVAVPTDPSGTTRVKLGVTSDGATRAYRWRSTWFDRWVWETPLAISGSVVFPNGRTFDLGDGNGIATLVDWYHVQREWIPQQPAGTPPANDLARSAEDLKPGARREVRVLGARLDPERRPDPFEHSLARTVWYRFTGTGQPMTLDTRGSDYDTAFMVYTMTERGPVELDYTDNVVLGRTTDAMTLQARSTFDTVAGATYLVQVGSVGNTDPTKDNAWSGYGTLNVSLQ